MFVGEIGSVVLVFNFMSFMPESGALLLCGVSLVGGAVVARRIFKRQDDEKNFRNDDESGEGGETK